MKITCSKCRTKNDRKEKVCSNCGDNLVKQGRKAVLTMGAIGLIITGIVVWSFSGYEIPEGVEYEIVSEKRQAYSDGNKINIRINLNKKIDSTELFDISHVIYDDYDSFKRVWLSYSVPSVYTFEPEKVYASSSFLPDPEYDQYILGSTPLQDSLILEEVRKVKGDIKGVWKFETILGTAMILHKENNILYFTNIYKDLGTATDEVTMMDDGIFMVKGNPDEKYHINEDGNLELSFPSGYMDIGKKIKL